MQFLLYFSLFLNLRICLGTFFFLWSDNIFSRWLKMSHNICNSYQFMSKNVYICLPKQLIVCRDQVMKYQAVTVAVIAVLYELECSKEATGVALHRRITSRLSPFFRSQMSSCNFSLAACFCFQPVTRSRLPINVGTSGHTWAIRNSFAARQQRQSFPVIQLRDYEKAV